MDERPVTIRDYRDLIVGKEAMCTAEFVYALTREFPRAEIFGMTAQMRRSAVSVPANVAEGFGRARRRSFIQFLRIAQGALKELETHARLCGRAGLLPADSAAQLCSRCEQPGRRLVMFVRALERHPRGQ